MKLYKLASKDYNIYNNLWHPSEKNSINKRKSIKTSKHSN